MHRIIRISLRLALLVVAGALSACASSPRTGPNLAATSRHPGLTCAPFARELSGIALYGDAATWWDGAAGRYGRASSPMVGGVLVFRRSSRLSSGHVSVVSRILTPRQITVISANWVRDELDEDQLVVDVSERNDWTQVRVWYPPSNQLGIFTYSTYGFVLPPRPATHEELVRATRPAAVYAIDNRGRPLPRARYVGG
ncbi:CHAP domain-containing protein [Limobrevibacterium gyesilva]|uniref:CHAP domain-containing protein n=1 Tax=Limobrevibacterium gyesilva TaxID=2991712 RepID=A0AA42CFU8_9PROT|nr:CHAP domain-containing protein [Limobrevibacterium gyesilva]MCW3473372.1 CHAP domain-containing protein [Limobrevibacterium gyesilva]